MYINLSLKLYIVDSIRLCSPSDHPWLSNSLSLGLPTYIFHIYYVVGFVSLRFYRLTITLIVAVSSTTELAGNFRSVYCLSSRSSRSGFNRSALKHNGHYIQLPNMHKRFSVPLSDQSCSLPFQQYTSLKCL